MLEFIDGTRQALKMSREVMANKMEKKSGESWDKGKLDKTLTSESCPRAETVFLMLEVLGMAGYPFEWCRSKRVSEEDE